MRNALAYEPLPFKGKDDRIEFPSYRKKLLKVDYFLKAGKLIRSEEGMKEDWKDKESASKPVLSGIKTIYFEYLYKQEEGDTVFLPFWLEEPYQGIPKAIRVRVELANGIQFSKVISIPQGRLGQAESCGLTLSARPSGPGAPGSLPEGKAP